MSVLMKFLLFLRTYWHYFLILFGILWCYNLYLKQSNVLSEIEKLRKIQSDEIANILVTVEQRDKAYIDNIKKLESRLNEIDQEYQTAKEQLNAKKDNEKKRILQETSDDPVELAKQFSDATGFKVVH